MSFAFHACVQPFDNILRIVACQSSKFPPKFHQRLSKLTKINRLATFVAFSHFKTSNSKVSRSTSSKPSHDILRMHLYPCDVTQLHSWGEGIVVMAQKPFLLSSFRIVFLACNDITTSFYVFFSEECF